MKDFFENITAKKIIILIVLISTVYLLVDGFFKRQAAQTEGYANYVEKREVEKNMEVLEKRNKINKQILFVTDSSLKQNSATLNSIRNIGYDLKMVSEPGLSYAVYNNVVELIQSNQLNCGTVIINGALFYDFTTGCIVGNMGDYKKETFEIEKRYSLCGRINAIDQLVDANTNIKNVIIVGTPCYKGKENREHDEATYKDTLTVVKMLCEINEINYIDVYSFTKDNPVEYNNGAEYNEEIQKYIYEQIYEIIGEYEKETKL